MYVEPCQAARPDARADAEPPHSRGGRVGASGRQRVQIESIKNYIIAKPTQNLLDHFAELVRPNFSLIQELINKNQNLRKTRDLLLPKLMSEEVEV